jgi:hypothetical protein
VASFPPAFLLITISTSPHSWYKPCPSHSPLLDNYNYTWWKAQIMKIPIMLFFPPSHHFMPPWSYIFLTTLSSNTLSLGSRPTATRKIWRHWESNPGPLGLTSEAVWVAPIWWKMCHFMQQHHWSSLHCQLCYTCMPFHAPQLICDAMTL